MAWIDLHTDILWNMTKLGADPLSAGSGLHSDLPRLLATDVRLAVWAVFVEPEEEGPAQTADALAQCAAGERVVAASAGAIVPVRTRQDFEELLRRQQTAEGPPAPLGPAGAGRGWHGRLLGLEGLHPLRGSLELADRFAEAGVRLMTLTWNHGNQFGAGCRHPHSGRQGLTPAGRRLLERMAGHGIILDLAHAGPCTLREALEAAPGPVLVSHTCCAALCEHPRNLSDGDLALVAAHDALVGITLHPAFLRGEAQDATSRDVAAHIVHAIRVAGLRHVAIGTDFDGITRTPLDMLGVEALPKLRRALAAQGLDEEAIDAVAWTNARRFLLASLPTAPSGTAAPGGEGG